MVLSVCDETPGVLAQEGTFGVVFEELKLGWNTVADGRRTFRCTLEAACRPLLNAAANFIGQFAPGTPAHCFLVYEDDKGAVVYSFGPDNAGKIRGESTRKDPGPSQDAVDDVHRSDHKFNDRRKHAGEVEVRDAQGRLIMRYPPRPELVLITLQRCSACDENTKAALDTSVRTIGSAQVVYAAQNGPNSNSAAVFAWTHSCPDPWQGPKGLRGATQAGVFGP